MKIYYIDDEEINLMLMQMLVESKGVDCETFNNFDALKSALAHRAHPDIVITDIKMPGVDGFAVVQDLAEHYPNLPVAYCTAFSSLEDAFNSSDKQYKHDLKRPCYIKPIRVDVVEFAESTIADFR